MERSLLRSPEGRARAEARRPKRVVSGGQWPQDEPRFLVFSGVWCGKMWILPWEKWENPWSNWWNPIETGNDAWNCVFFKGIGLIFRWGWWDFSPNDSTATTLGESIDWGGKMKPLWAWKQDEGSFWLLGFPARLFWEYWKIDQPDLRWQCSSLLGLSEIPQWCSQGLRPLAKPCQKGQGAQSVLSVRNPPWWLTLIYHANFTCMLQLQPWK